MNEHFYIHMPTTTNQHQTITGINLNSLEHGASYSRIVVFLLGGWFDKI